ncbi:InlB B-repeat-containing protein [Gemmiger formicilis]|uniref:InlB B-repeat-containing protein n=1 Tax=Gemmiger formicilis TaxID=745368 RepID=UPI00399AB184
MLALVLALSITPNVFAEETVGGTTIYVDAKNGNDAQEGVGTASDKAYKTVAAAVAAAKSGDTIRLGEGNYTLYGVSSEGHTKDKDLTFVGQGSDKTGWNIGAEVPNPANFGTEYNGDYSFDGAKTIAFENMTLRSGDANYLGFIRANNTIVENCVINGKTFYWGYQTATFSNTTFNCPNGDYAIWTYSSPVMTFDNCTFNSSGKVINVYTDAGAGKNDITVNFSGCTVNNSGLSLKPVLNINDSNMGNYKYVINISGDNVVNGVNTDKITCSRLFGYGGKTGNNTGRTIVNFGNTPVWQDSKMVDAEAYHNSGVTSDGVTYTNGVEGSNNSLYAEGYKDHALVTTYGEWIANEDGTITRDVTKKCTYCGYEEKVKEYQVKLTYDANGGEGAIDSATGAAGESVTVAENVFTRNNYTFTGWNTQADGKGTAYKAGDSFTLTDEDTVLYAQWSENAPAQVKVSYDANGGTGIMESITGDVGSKIVIGQNGFSRSGYTFTGWNTQADGKGTAYKAGDSFTLTDKDTVLYAQWNKLVTVSFDLCGHGGANISSQTFVGGNKASELTAPKEDGWVFGGWYTEKGCKYRFSFDSAVTSDITLYAKWDRVTTVVSAPVATPTPSPAPAAAATKTATVKNAAIPQTSDAFPMEGLLVLLAVGAVGFGAAGWLRKKHH